MAFAEVLYANPLTQDLMMAEPIRSGTGFDALDYFSGLGN